MCVEVCESAAYGLYGYRLGRTTKCRRDQKGEVEVNRALSRLQRRCGSRDATCTCSAGPSDTRCVGSANIGHSSPAALTEGLPVAVLERLVPKTNGASPARTGVVFSLRLLKVEIESRAGVSQVLSGSVEGALGQVRGGKIRFRTLEVGLG